MAPHMGLGALAACDALDAAESLPGLVRQKRLGRLALGNPLHSRCQHGGK